MKEIDPTAYQRLQQVAADACHDLRAETPHGSRLYFHLCGVIERLAMTGIYGQQTILHGRNEHGMDAREPKTADRGS